MSRRLRLSIVVVAAAAVCAFLIGVAVAADEPPTRVCISSATASIVDDEIVESKTSTDCTP